ncbi:hypothetical protein DPMN_038272 [Dreissena polymorpha]|uniref:HAT C-terminal dimerisation domain-containing protein n=1 Tax=Dreissena polymorpha TaxID=45954 RepID=A0A9D4MDZ1_DREPO|nr:hypothetical protein DPMN_112456 [Dreissena polymorpha]KAH3875013.1 hypothetical protein DPMN_038272 [Dreissena polymorpha]
MFDKFQSLKFSAMAERALNSTDLLLVYPNVCKLIRVCLILPVSSADCERGFSRYNLIKIKQRNRLYVSTVNTLMMMTVDTPDISDMNQFNFGRAFDVWAVSKARRFGNKAK